MAKYSDFKKEYTRLWNRMVIHQDRLVEIDRIAKRLLSHKTRYETVQLPTGVPWFVIAVIHERESGADFSTYLGNGDSLSRPTVNVPEGRGPFPSWEAGAKDALAYDKLDQNRDWTAAHTAWVLENFNGAGYRNKGVPSPYLWSFSNNYVSGKYTSDHGYDPKAVDKQAGVMPLLKRIMELDKTAKFQGEPISPEVASSGAVVAAGAAGTAAAASAGVSTQNTIGIALAMVALAVAIFFVVKWFTRDKQE